jgi:hypothetical protein
LISGYTMKNIAGQVSGLYWCAVAGDAMQAANKLRVITGKGLEGDRYATGMGAYSDSQPPKIRHLSLITEEAIEIANEWQQAAGLRSFGITQTRRNVLLNGTSAQALNSLVGQIFWVGHIQCRGIELCTPCPRPSQLSLQSGFQEAFEGRGGLRAEVLRGGEVAIGDVLRCEQPGGTTTY